MLREADYYLTMILFKQLPLQIFNIYKKSGLVEWNNRNKHEYFFIVFNLFLQKVHTIITLKNTMLWDLD